MEIRNKSRIVEVFRKLARREDPLRADAQLAVELLAGFRRHFNLPERRDSLAPAEEAWEFFAQCYGWFLDKQQAFPSADDDEVIRLVSNRFKAHCRDMLREERLKERLPWRAEQIPPNCSLESLAPFDFEQVNSLSAAELEEIRTSNRKGFRRRGGTSRAELARDLKELKKEYGVLKKLRPYPELFGYHLRRCIEAECIRDPEKRPGYAEGLEELKAAILPSQK